MVHIDICSYSRLESACVVTVNENAKGWGRLKLTGNAAVRRAMNLSDLIKHVALDQSMMAKKDLFSQLVWFWFHELGLLLVDLHNN